jgi:hypothetical protein
MQGKWLHHTLPEFPSKWKIMGIQDHNEECPVNLGQMGVGGLIDIKFEDNLADIYIL